VLQPGGADELLEQAQSERNKFLKDLLYTRAAMSAMTGGDFDRALSIVEKLGDEDRRAGLGSMIKLQAAAVALRKDDPDSALRYAAGVSDLRQRAYLYGTIARTLFDKNEAVRAIGVLGEAERDIDKADDDAVKANALLIIAEVKTRIDPVQGFEAAGAAVKAFNRADSAGKDGRAPSPAGGPSALSAILNSTLKLDAPNFEPVFLRLAKADFNRAVQLARTLERNDRSVPAQLAACQGTLAPRQEKRGQTAKKKVK
jgi:tetratricopeptide (TPR) repeat protein